MLLLPVAVLPSHSASNPATVMFRCWREAAIEFWVTAQNYLRGDNLSLHYLLKVGLFCWVTGPRWEAERRGLRQESRCRNVP